MDLSKEMEKHLEIVVKKLDDILKGKVRIKLYALYALNLAMISSFFYRGVNNVI